MKDEDEKKRWKMRFCSIKTVVKMRKMRKLKGSF